MSEDKIEWDYEKNSFQFTIVNAALIGTLEIY